MPTWLIILLIRSIMRQSRILILRILMRCAPLTLITLLMWRLQLTTYRLQLLPNIANSTNTTRTTNIRIPCTCALTTIMIVRHTQRIRLTRMILPTLRTLRALRVRPLRAVLHTLRTLHALIHRWGILRILQTPLIRFNNTIDTNTRDHITKATVEYTTILIIIRLCMLQRIRPFESYR